MKNITISIPPLKVSITPFAMARMSDDLHRASLAYLPNRFPLLNFFLYSASIELGLKSAVLSKQCTKEKKKVLKNFGHDLLLVHEDFKKEFDAGLFDEDEVISLSKINKYYKDKGLEYFTVGMIVSATTAYEDFPAIEEIKSISNKVNTLLKNNKYFISC